MSDVTEYLRRGVDRDARRKQLDENLRHKGGPMIEITDLVKSYGSRQVLKGINMHVNPGEVVVVMGPSGCGKSSLLRCIIGAQPYNSGQILIDGQDVGTANEVRLNRVRRKFGVLFQSAALFNSLSVGENVALPIRFHTELPDSTIEIMVRLKLELVGLRDSYLQTPAQLSGGQKKRVGLARAIALDPDIVFYDEPSAGLDPIVIGAVDKLIVDLGHSLNITSVVITHEMHSAMRIADRIYMVYDGRIVAHGTPEEMQQSDDPIVEQFLSGNAEGPIAPPAVSGQFIDSLIS
ncbi:MAG: ABC transporter ATP-binding protein [Planctomycetota bacterium]